MPDIIFKATDLSIDEIKQTTKKYNEMVRKANLIEELAIPVYPDIIPDHIAIYI